MPNPDSYSLHLMAVYQDCAQRQCLPVFGGLFDQDEELMRSFRLIDERIAMHKKQKSWEVEREGALLSARRELRGGH